MLLSAIFSSLHLLALAIGLPSVFLRGRALHGTLDDRGYRRLFNADTGWGIAAGLWIVTGLIRAFGGLEKGSAFYLSSPLFWVKMGLLLLILVLEVWPMLTFITWRRQRGHGQVPNTSIAGRLYGINQLQLGLVILMVFVASGMARGIGLT
jgi:putative membrane protein